MTFPICCRRRSCGNPEPTFGGKGCIGRDSDQKYCDDQPACSSISPAAGAASSASLIRQGSWTQWTQWSDCSAICGKGFRNRSRKCYGDGECLGGCDRDYQECEGPRTDCAETSEVMEVTDWTPWVKSNSSVDGAWYEKRFRFSYRSAGSSGAGNNDLQEEERYCTGRNQCAVSSARGGASSDFFANSWGEWSKCSRECGTGYQVRIRSNGLSVVERPCNTRPCKGQWGCWSEWSEGCDHRGKRTRTRECDGGAFPHDSEVRCLGGGGDFEEGACEDEEGGWGAWSEWTDECDVNGYQRRYRVCVARQCRGNDVDRRPCAGISSDGGGGGSAVPVAEERSASSGEIAAAVVIGFVLGTLTGAGLVYFLLVYRRCGGRGGNGSPHYMSAKSQNLYVSLPMLDLNRSKNNYSSNQSDCGTMRSTTTTGSTLRSNKALHGGSVSRNFNGSVVSDYETATIKRSHSHRNSSILVAATAASNGGGANGTLNMRADLDADSLFT